jgi:hypothetical protein
MKKLLTLIPLIFIACSTVEPQQPDSPTPALATPQPVAVETPVPLDNNLSDLNAMTFTCPKAALNIAAREAKKAPSLGSYQFSFFRIVNNSHHAQYEVHFKSNVLEEPELKYCVSIYCQQGWDPNTSKSTVRLISDSGLQSGDPKKSAHEPSCGYGPAAHAPSKKANLK